MLRASIHPYKVNVGGAISQLRFDKRRNVLAFVFGGQSAGKSREIVGAFRESACSAC